MRLCCVSALISMALIGCGGSPVSSGGSSRGIAGIAPQPGPSGADTSARASDAKANPTVSVRPGVTQRVLQSPGVKIQAPVGARLPRLRIPSGSPTVDVPAPPLVAQPGPWPTPGPDLTQCAAPIATDLSEVTYVCDCQPGAAAACVAGSDGNPGTSTAPLRSFSAAMNALRGLSNGGTVALCRGGLWKTGSERINRSYGCSAEAPCVLGDYEAQWTAESQPAPVVELVAPGNTPLFNISSGSTTHLNQGFIFRNLKLVSAHREGKGFFFYRRVADVQMSCLDISGFSVGIHVANNGARITLSDSHVHHNGEQGYLGGCDDCGIVRGHFDNNGFARADIGEGMFSHNVYMSATDQGGYATQGMYIRDSYLTRSAVNTASGKCMGVSLVVHGGMIDNLQITGNVIEEPTGGADFGCWGIAVDAAVPRPERNQDILISGNVIRNVGNMGIGLSSCVRCTVQNNVIIQEAMGGMRGIAIPSRPRSDNDAISTESMVRNNTIYLAQVGAGVLVGGEGSGHSVVNNIVAYEGTTGLCFALDLPVGSYGAVSSNQCSGGVLDVGINAMDSEVGVASPEFLDAPRDLRLAPNSPAVDSARTGQGPQRDLLGTARGARPDRGAFERL